MSCRTDSTTSGPLPREPLRRASRTCRHTIDGRQFTIDEIKAADSCLFDVFPRKTLQGNLKEGLSRPYYCVVSRSMAERIGGNVVGKAFNLRDYDYKLIIGGVYDDFPCNSNLHDIDVIVSLPTTLKVFDWDIVHHWTGTDRFSSFIRLRKGTDCSAQRICRG